uniref:Ribonuclease T n=1 Tax=Zeugodacus cucurbitae TaxID=28588 RepID=A0A0A1XID2_ZEUCU
MSTKVPPAYINANYIQQAMECYFEKCVIILECTFKCIALEGEYCSSDIYRTQVKFEINRHGRRVYDNMSIIVKDAVMDVSAPMGTNELVMFKHVLPHVRRILSEVTFYHYQVPETDHRTLLTKMFADCLFCERGKNEVFVLEDLKASNYKKVDHRKGLDLELSRAVMRKLADFHAATMIYLNTYPSAAATLFPSTFANGISPISRHAAKVFEGMRTAIKLVEQWTGFGGIAASMRIWLENCNERLTQVLQTERCRFQVITHGELWAKNILMRMSQKYCVGELRDAAFVDFQLSFVGSCGYDLNVFLNTSVQLEVLKAHRYELLRYYYDRLTETLKYLNWEEEKIPSWETVMSEVYDLEFIGYYALLYLLPISCMEREAPTQDSEKQHTSLYENERVQEMFRYALERFAKLGVLECVIQESDNPPS